MRRGGGGQHALPLSRDCARKCFSATAWRWRRHRVGAGFRILAFKGIDDHQMLVDGFFHPPLQTDIVRAVAGKELVQMADNVDENRISGHHRQEGMNWASNSPSFSPCRSFNADRRQ